ncbi:MAG: N-acetyltransferase [Pseudomonadota bacterium]|nr:N-acetyltransferase [Pseudomonadota bacterium]
MTDTEIIPVRSRRDLNDFITVPHAIFAHDPQWIAPLHVERREHLSMRKNPYFRHAEAQLFLARRGGKTVGRVSAQIDRLHIARYDDATGQFGFLDAVDEAPVFAKLLHEAESWLGERGIRRIQGPFSFSINDESGLLVDGFHQPPFVMMGHAKPYYAAHVETAGYRPVKDLLAYEYDLRNPIPRAIGAIIAKNKASGKLVLRPLSKRNLARDLEIIIAIFNDAWSANWNFVPMTREEIENLGRVLKLLVSGEHVAIASFDGDPAAMVVTLPDINGMIGDLDGKLLPFGWARLLWRLKFRTHAGARLPLMGVKARYRGSMVSAMLAFALIDRIRTFHLSRGTLRGELSWVLEDNMPLRRILDAIGAVPYKTYRVYEKSLG